MECKCPCGGGQSCIVDRRLLYDYVHEDALFDEAGIPRRKNCYQEYTTEQGNCLKKVLKKFSQRGAKKLKGINYFGTYGIPCPTLIISLFTCVAKALSEVNSPDKSGKYTSHNTRPHLSKSYK